MTKFIDKFIADDTVNLAASLAFYTALSLAPLLILFVSVTARLEPALQQGLINQVGDVAGRDAAVSVAAVIHGAALEPRFSSLAGILGVGTLLFSASLIFGSLRATLNKILAVPSRNTRTPSYAKIVFNYLREKLLHVLLAVAFILMMIASVFVSTVVSSDLEKFGFWQVAMNALFSALFYVAIFSLLFRYIPDKKLRWARALQGGALTSVLFVVGKELIAAYLGNAAIGSAYGAAGSIVVLLVWVYYSALITFVGAQVSALLELAHKAA